jgi:protein TonB
VKVKLTRGYFARIRGAINGRKQYPFAARRMGVTGDVRVSFTIGPDGSFFTVTLRRSSGHTVLDQAALRAVRSVSRAVQRPTQLGETPLRMTVLLRYQLDS